MTPLRLTFALCLASLFLPGASAAELLPGVSAGVNFVQDYFRNLQGGRHRGGAGPGRLDLYLDVDGRAWGGSADNRFYLDLLGTDGGSISAQAGDLQTLDNVEAVNTFKVFEAWYLHRFDGGVEVQIGLQDLNARFSVLDAAATLINSSFGIDPTIAQAGAGIFPTSSVGGLVRWESAGGAYVMGGVFDGVPGLPGHPYGTQIHFLKGEGVFAAVEGGISGAGDSPYKLALGGWYRTSVYTDPAGRSRDRNQGLYAIAQARLWRYRGASLDAFLQLGLAAADRNMLDHYIGAGLSATGLIPGRPHDVISAGLARAHLSRVYRRHTPGSLAAETALEITWRAEINDHVALQPDLQYIIHPGADAALDNAWLVGLRAELNW